MRGAPEPGDDPLLDDEEAEATPSSGPVVRLREVAQRVSDPSGKPPPDFRYVALEPAKGARLSRALVLGGAAVAGLGLVVAHGGSGMVLSFVGACMSSMGLVLGARRRDDGPALALVPWGLIVESESEPRALFWSSVRAVRVTTAHGRDGGNTTTVATFVTVETSTETFSGRTPGEANLERLEAHLASYAEEQAAPLALDLAGTRPCEITDADGGERVVRSARSWLGSAEAHVELGLESGTYRATSVRAASPLADARLRAVLRAPVESGHADPRAFAAVVAAELGAFDVVPELLALVQSPHPLVAAFAKQAARRLGAPTSRVGSLDEVAPFLRADDLRVLRDWGGDTAHEAAAGDQPEALERIELSHG